MKKFNSSNALLFLMAFVALSCQKSETKQEIATAETLPNSLSDEEKAAGWC